MKAARRMVWQDGAIGDGIPRGVVESVRICLRKYDVFSGRAPRAEYWWFILFSTLLQVVLTIVTGVAVGFGPSVTGGAVRAVAGLLLLLPGIAVTTRRLHDTDRSGWWQCIGFVPLVGSIILLVWLCSRGTHGSNRFGPENGIV